MKKAFIFTLLLSIPLILAQCNHSENGDRHHMTGDEQISQMMQSPEQRQAMMNHMTENPEMHHELMTHMHSSMMSQNHDHMLNRMETMMNDPEQREQMKSHMQQMMEMMESGEFDREQMREMMEQSPMIGMHMNCMQMMTDM